MKSKYNAIWGVLKTLLIDLIGRKLIKAGIAKLALYTVVGPFKAWLVSLLVDELLDHIVIPVLNELQVVAEFETDKASGRKKIKKIDKAKHDNDIQTYANTLSDV